jgi:flagellar biosynthesis protein FliR
VQALDASVGTEVSLAVAVAMVRGGILVMAVQVVFAALLPLRVRVVLAVAVVMV